MNNPGFSPDARTTRSNRANFYFTVLTVAIMSAMAGSCSTVFRSSIQGTIIDLEDYEDGITTGVGDAKVFLYTDLAARDEDFSAYIDGDESTLPDGQSKLKYFQSTITGANGSYDFSGFIWHNLFPVFGKTADRKEVYLLVYHPDYGLWKSPVAIVVSDVTNHLDQIKIEDLWNQGRLVGTVLDWKDDEPLAGVTVNFYVAESWTYDAAGVIDTAVYPTDTSATSTTDADGRWSADLRFRKMPDRAGDKGTAPVRVVYLLNDYRVNDDLPGDTGLSTTNSATGIKTTFDLDRDGVTAADGDYEDAFVVATVQVESETHAMTTLAEMTMQRWRFSATVMGTVKEGVQNIDNKKITLTTPDNAEYKTYSEAGVFNLGTITWTIPNVVDAITGEVNVIMSVEGANTLTGEAESLLPDVQRNLTLEVTL